ncbi:hypothetical protein Sjap_023906 [Stephania japonica]|uniref:Uncharacterized protein n=1 Tax=Stephania japonica TaxID=461633 RepID=A0AAP0EL44_9MAGN
MIAMTDQIEPSDNSGAAGPRVICVEDFQAFDIESRAQDQRLEEILRILRTLVATTPSSPSTLGVLAT